MAASGAASCSPVASSHAVRSSSILTIVATCVSCGVTPRAYLHLVTTLIINRWPHAKLRDLLLDRLAVAHTELLVQDGPLLGPTATAP